jgi:murein DD-endopeptidase MepM/ murein hydrolase activator NlpD
MMKKIILSILILSVVALLFSGCDGGNLVPPSIIPPTPIFEIDETYPGLQKWLFGDAQNVALTAKWSERDCSIWGPELSPLLWNCQHTGIDYGVSAGTPVYSATKGKVIRVEQGNDCTEINCLSTVAILNEDVNTTFIYLHMKDIKVEKDEQVKAGDQIGSVGQRGPATGPHLHFEARMGENYHAALDIRNTINPYEEAKKARSTSLLTPEEIELIRKWGFGGDYVVRWPNGYVDVYDETNYSRMQEIINEWNSVIGGPVVFRLSNNPNSQVRIYYKSIPNNYCGNRIVNWDEHYTFSSVDLQIEGDSSDCGYPSTKYSLYLFMFKNAVGFKGWTTKGEDVPYDEWTNFTEINNTMEKMVYALYKVSPGYYLGEGKLIINKEVKTNKQIGLMQSGDFHK